MANKTGIGIGILIAAVVAFLVLGKKAGAGPIIPPLVVPVPSVNPPVIPPALPAIPPAVAPVADQTKGKLIISVSPALGNYKINVTSPSGNNMTWHAGTFEVSPGVYKFNPVAVNYLSGAFSWYVAAGKTDRINIQFVPVNNYEKTVMQSSGIRRFSNVRSR